MRSKELSVERGDRIVSRHRSGEQHQKMSAALKNTVASIILKWKKFGTTETLPRAVRPAKLCNQWRRAFVMEVTKYPMVTERAPEGENLPEGQLSLQHSTTFRPLW
ncbi:unnamed protein product [Oncorhynchus mykiss]|uniref:Sleeping Beauty transposase HTH domain-containing protein n=1 Tax=Oncorhynchus mykiss TaxID=8022 RepID=A0A060WE98_ONCMY|nr:unnamed protein product [Oncorhynchus mykiss]